MDMYPAGQTEPPRAQDSATQKEIATVFACSDMRLLLVSLLTSLLLRFHRAVPARFLLEPFQSAYPSSSSADCKASNSSKASKSASCSGPERRPTPS